jgi:hypothetical protein
MLKLDIILISVATIETIVLILSFIYWVKMFYDYKNTSKHLKTLEAMEFPADIAKLSGDSKKHAMEISSLAESFANLNAKLTARWRREAKSEQQAPTGKIPSVIPPDFPQAEDVTPLPVKPHNHMSFVKRKKALFR